MATDLINENADGNGFLVGVNPMNLNLFCTLGTTTQTSYVVPGTIATSASTTAQSILFSQKTTVTSLSMVYNAIITTPNCITVSLFNTTTPATGGSGTLIGTFSMPAQSTGVFTASRFLNFSSTIDPTLSPPQFLQVRVTTATGFTVGQALVMTIGTY